MPVHPIRNKKGKIIGYQWGKSGKKYYGKSARKKAQKQGTAIRKSGYKNK